MTNHSVPQHGLGLVADGNWKNVPGIRPMSDCHLNQKGSLPLQSLAAWRKAVSILEAAGPILADRPTR